MRFAGTPSWRLESDSPQSLHFALYVRDAAALEPPPSGDVPPAVSASVGLSAERLPLAAREDAESQWLDWWRVASEVSCYAQHRTQRTDVGAQHLAARARSAAGRPHGWDPPQFASLADRPELQSAVLAAMPCALRWASNSKGPALGPAWSVDWATIRDVVHAVAEKHGLRHDEISGTVLILAVTGHWSYHPAPGVALCSLATAVDPESAAPMLAELLTPPRPAQAATT